MQAFRRRAGHPEFSGTIRALRRRRAAVAAAAIVALGLTAGAASADPGSAIPGGRVDTSGESTMSDAEARATGAQGGSRTAPASELAALPAAEKSPDARTLPDHGDSGRASRVHYIYYSPMSWTATPPPQDPQAGVAAYVEAANAYWQRASRNVVGVEVGWANPWAKIDLTASEVARCDRKAIWREVAKQVTGGRPVDHVLVNLPYNPACDWTDLEYVGPTTEGFGLTLTNGLIVPDDRIISRAMLHNNYVLSSGYTECVDEAGTRVPLSDNCTYSDYTDPWDPASGQPFDETGMPHVETLWEFGLLGNADRPQLEVGVDRTVTIRRLADSSSGIRGVWFDTGDHYYFLEYRAALGLDDWVDRQSISHNGIEYDTPGGGVVMQRLHKTHLAAKQTIDFHPELPAGKNRHPGLTAGERYTAPDGLFSLRVVSADSTEAQVQITWPGVTAVDRWSGADRYDASASISASTFEPGVGVAYIASGDVFTDALSGAPVAGMRGGPVLLTKRDELPGVIAQELRRLKPRAVVILGGEATITPTVGLQLRNVTGLTPRRLSGPDRFSTSAAISAAAYPSGADTVYVASGRVFTDALSAAPVAGRDRSPVLLTDTASLPAAIAGELSRLNPTRIVLLGGTNTISTGVEAELAAYAERVDRIAGPDRFSTSTAITSASYPSADTVYVASGRVFTDALSGAPVAGYTGGPILLVDTRSLPDVTRAELTRLRPKRIVVLGGGNTISYEVQAALSRYLTS